MTSREKTAPKNLLAQRNKSPSEKWLTYLGLPLAIIVFTLLYTMPAPAGVTMQGKAAAAVFFLALILWVSEAIPVYVTALVAIVLLAITGAWDEKSILGVFGYDVIWLMVAAFIITSGMEKTGLGKRLALFMITKFGKTAKTALLVMIIVNFIITLVVPSTTARAAIMLPLALALAEAYGAIPGKSNFGRLLMIQELQANNISTSGILTATAPQIMAVGFLKDLAGVNVSWGQWFLAAMPIAFMTMILGYFIGLLLYPPEVSTPKGQGLEKMGAEIKNMGRLNREEWKALGIFVLTVFLWATGPYHVKMFGFNISLVMVAILAATLMYLTGLLNWKETQIPWDLMIFSCGAYAVGMALENAGIASWALSRIFGAANLSQLPFILVFAAVVFISSFSHMVFTSKTVRTAILLPTIIELAKVTGYNPLALALPAAFTIADSITLPPNCKPNLIFYSTGQFTVTNQLFYGVIVLLVKCALMCLAAVTWFKWIGLY